MTANAEALVVELLRSGGIDAYADVPARRPERFVTVERTGGAKIDRVLDAATLAVQCWAKTRYEASELALEARERIEGMVSDSRVASASVQSVYNFPDIENKQPRYQLTATVTIMG